MKRIFTIAMVFFSLAALPAFTACSPDESMTNSGGETPAPNPQPDPQPDPPEPDPDPTPGNTLRITVGTASFTASLADNDAARAFAALLPMSVPMSELNGNEKYYYLPERLPTASYRPETIRSGDLKLYGSDCLVLFYETFRNSYSYTRLGRLDNAEGLASAVGPGGVTVKFEIMR